MSEEYPDFVARFYDPIYDSLRTGVDHDFFVRQMSAADGLVLEVGVGTGRMFLDALQDGVDVRGIDVSAAMLEALRNKLPAEDHQRVQQMDVRNLDLPDRFALIVAPFRVFSHLISVDAQLQALNAIAAHLADGGRFVFDLFAPNYGMLASGTERTLDFDGEHQPGESLRRFVSVVNHPATQINDVTMEFEWTENAQTFHKVWSFPMRYFFRFELEHLVARSDLQLVGMCGDYTGGPVEDTSRDYVIECRR